jgi:hypothetical protein
MPRRRWLTEEIATAPPAALEALATPGVDACC